jgi:hypothetical protein
MDPLLADAVLSRLSTSLGGAYQAEVLRQWIMKWQQEIQEAMEQERAAAAKKKRPIWQCVVCGSYSCQFMPRIIGYQEVD